MSSDYLEQLDDSSLGLLAETAGMAQASDGARFFSDRPHEIRQALGSPEAAILLTDAAIDDPNQRRLLQLAIAVHRTAQQMCAAGWTARDDGGPIDLELVRFAGQGEHLLFLVDLLASFLPARWQVPADLETPPATATRARLDFLLELCSEVAETERAGALRLLADEALFASSVFPAELHAIALDDELVAAMRSVLPRAVNSLLDELTPQLHTLLDAYLQFGPVWYRMASQNLLHRGMRESLGVMAKEFGTARRFLVRVAQGPMAGLRDELFLATC